MNTSRRDTGGKLPAGIGIIRNTTGQREHITTWDECREHLLKINRNPRYLKPIVKVRKSKSLFNLLFGWLWKWECRICYQNRLASTWEKAIEQATHHAHNHHRSQK